MWKYVDPKSEKCKLPYCDKCFGAYLISIVIAIWIIIYFFIIRGIYGVRRMTHNDIMNQKIFDMRIMGENCCSWWPISHFILFMILGILFPDCDVVIISAGVLWELFEVTWSTLEGSQREELRSKEKIEYSKNWWAGSFKDILFNIAGFYTGKLLVKIRSKRPCIHILQNCPEN
jgi:hypothetical protein